MINNGSYFTLGLLFLNEPTKISVSSVQQVYRKNFGFWFGNRLVRYFKKKTLTNFEPN